MQVILEVHTGALTGRRIPLALNQTVRLGRTAETGHAFPQDEHMSGEHFAVECGEGQCMLRDLGSRNGTFVNGQQVTEAALKDGDEIQAGSTTFRVRMAQEPMPAPIMPAEEQGKAAAGLTQPEKPVKPAARLLNLLRTEFQPLCAVLDAAREPDVLKVLFESKTEYQSLFAGADGAKLAHFAPYLVRLPKESPLLDALTHGAWGKSWGIYLTCDQPLLTLHAHFRQFLMVNQPDGKQVYFRFYDPRVLRVYLPTCLPEEVAQFFGPVKYYVMEDEKPDTLLRFSNAVRGVGLRRVPLVDEGTIMNSAGSTARSNEPALRPNRNA